MKYNFPRALIIRTTRDRKHEGGCQQNDFTIISINYTYNYTHRLHFVFIGVFYGIKIQADLYDALFNSPKAEARQREKS